eukprot:2975377-Ditylum_brightwellii.AAC.1
MECSLGGGRLHTLSSSNGITWGLLCQFTLGDDVGIVGFDIGGLVGTLRSGVISFLDADWTCLPITLRGGTLSPVCVAFSKILANWRIAYNWSSPTLQMVHLYLALSALQRDFLPHELPPPLHLCV